MEEYRKFYDNYFDNFSIGAALIFPFYCIFLSVYGFVKRIFFQ